MPESGVIGINRRNIDYVFKLNRRRDFALVDNKLHTKELFDQAAIPMPRMLCGARHHFELDGLMACVARHTSFVIKPARGYGGTGILVVAGRKGSDYLLLDGRVMSVPRLQTHLFEILAGVYSLDNEIDAIIVEERITVHPDLRWCATPGLPDVRLIIYRGRPMLSMVRVPTRESGGKANLHAGGFAVAVNLRSGVTGNGWYRGRRIDTHPETGTILKGNCLPCWQELLTIAARLKDVLPLGFMGVDLVLDASRGPLCIECNARPGLEIQNVCGQGLGSLCHEGEE